LIKAKIYSSEKLIHFNREDLDSNYYRADLILKGVDIRVPSYVGKVYLNNTDASYDTPEELNDGYVGFYTVFGHATCLGDEGHCEELPETTFGEIATPMKKEDHYITITNNLKELSRNTEDFSVTIVPDVCEPPKLTEEEPDLGNIIKIDKVSIQLYDKDMG
jgi:hypothetical protein